MPRLCSTEHGFESQPCPKDTEPFLLHVSALCEIKPQQGASLAISCGEYLHSQNFPLGCLLLLKQSENKSFEHEIASHWKTERAV